MMMGGEIVILLGLVALGVFLVRGGFATRSQEGEKRSGADATEILAERFAKGEISEEEFLERKQALGRHTP